MKFSIFLIGMDFLSYCRAFRRFSGGSMANDPYLAAPFGIYPAVGYT